MVSPGNQKHGYYVPYVAPANMTPEEANKIPPQPIEEPLYDANGVDLNPYSQSGDAPQKSKIPWVIVSLVGVGLIVAFSSRK